jgi:uncharacterized protein YndB with AHSA1/START domain
MIGDVARVSVTVEVPPEAAFDIFTEDIDRWWRRGLRYRHSASSTGIIRIEPRLNGRLYESIGTDPDARIIEVGRVQVWDPPHRLEFTWRNSNYSEHEHTTVAVPGHGNPQRFSLTARRSPRAPRQRRAGLQPLNRPVVGRADELAAAALRRLLAPLIDPAPQSCR